MKMRKLSKKLFDNKAKWTAFKVVLFKQEVLETLLYGCATWTLKESDYVVLSRYHRFFLHRITGFRKSTLDITGRRLISYRQLLHITGCECIEALIRRRQLTFAGHIVRMSNDRLPKILMLGELQTTNRGRKGARKTWLTWLNDDLKLFNITTANWISGAQDEEKWAQEIDRGAKQFMLSWITRENAKHNKRVAKRLEQSRNTPINHFASP